MEVKLRLKYSVLVMVFQFLFIVQQISAPYNDQFIRSTCIADHKSYCHKISAEVIINTLAQLNLVPPEAENGKSFVDSEYLMWPKPFGSVTYQIEIQENQHHALYYTHNNRSQEPAAELEETNYEQAKYEKLIKLYKDSEGNKVFKYLHNMKSLLNEFSCKGNIFIYFTEELYQLKNGRLLAMTDYRSPFKKFLIDQSSSNPNTSSSESEKNNIGSTSSNIGHTEWNTREADTKNSVIEKLIPEDEQHLLNVGTDSLPESDDESKMKPGPSSVSEVLVGGQKSRMVQLNMIAGFSSLFELYVEFLPAVVRVNEEVFSARKEVEIKLQDFAHNNNCKHLSIIDVIAEKQDPQFGKVTYLMKQVISEFGTIVFIIPQYASVQPYENTKPLCENLCVQKEWIFESQLIVCCDPIKEKELIGKSVLPMNTNLQFDPLPVYVHRDEVKLEMNVGSLSGRSRSHYHYFCNKEITAEINDENRFVNILQQVSKDTQCTYPITDVLVTFGSSMRGIIIDLSPEINRTYDTLVYNSNSSNEIGNFYSGRNIFSNKPNLWFIKLSEFPIIHSSESIFWTYQMIPKQLFSQLRKRTSNKNKFPLPGPIECTFIGEPKLSTNMIFSKENITKQFIDAIGDIETGQMKIYLEYLWKMRYVQAAPYISYENMTFPRKQSFTSCTHLPIWTKIYENHRKGIIQEIKKIVNRTSAKTEVLIHEFQYKLLRFEKSNNPFHLHQNQTHPDENVSFYRYLIKIVITPESQIAFVTINDPFLLSDEVNSPFKNDEFISKFCLLDCVGELKYDKQIIDGKINYCCEVTDELLETLTMNSLMLSEYLKNKSGTKTIMRKHSSKTLLANMLF